MNFWIMFAVAMIISAIGFKKYVWFISIGYGFAIAGIGVALLIIFRGSLSLVTALLCILFIVYGIRLGGYLMVRELKSSSYNAKMKKEIKDGSDMNFFVKVLIWVTCALLYACQTSPVLFRMGSGAPAGVSAVIGLIIMISGIVLESASDLQKTRAKNINPGRFVDTGLFSFVRCPNYLGEVLFWTGVLVSGVATFDTALEWIVAIIGYVAIVYIMFGGARRLELRQNRTYGDDPEYQAYVKKVPILIPFIPLYSVADQKWLLG